MGWYVYLLECADGTYYTGITTDLERRLHEHNSDPKGARYTRARRPVTMVYSESCANRSDAARREYVVRKLNRQQKAALVASQVASRAASQA